MIATTNGNPLPHMYWWFAGMHNCACATLAAPLVAGCRRLGGEVMIQHDHAYQHECSACSYVHHAPSRPIGPVCPMRALPYAAPHVHIQSSRRCHVISMPVSHARWCPQHPSCTCPSVRRSIPCVMCSSKALLSWLMCKH